MTYAYSWTKIQFMYIYGLIESRYNSNTLEVSRLSQIILYSSGNSMARLIELILTGKVGLPRGTDGTSISHSRTECIAHNGWGSGIRVVVSIAMHTITFI